MKYIQKTCQYFIEKVKRVDRTEYNRRKQRRLKNRDFTIIASNCNGSFMYHDMKLKYLTPTVNLAIDMDDFVKMAENLKQYMEKEIVEVQGGRRMSRGFIG